MLGFALVGLVLWLAWPSSASGNSIVLNWLRDIASKTKRISTLNHGESWFPNAAGFGQVARAKLPSKQWRKVEASAGCELWRNDGSADLPVNLQYVTAEALLGKTPGWALAGNPLCFEQAQTQMLIDDRWLAVVEETPQPAANPETTAAKRAANPITMLAAATQTGVEKARKAEARKTEARKASGDPLELLKTATQAGIEKARKTQAPSRTAHSAVTGRVGDFPPGGNPLDLARAFSATIKS